MAFARSLAVVDAASLSWFAVGALIIAASVASVIAAMGAVTAGHRTKVIVALREL